MPENVWSRCLSFASTKKNPQKVTKPDIVFRNYQGVANKNGGVDLRENALFIKFQKMQMGGNLFINLLFEFKKDKIFATATKSESPF